MMSQSKWCICAVAMALSACLLGCPPAGPVIDVDPETLHFGQNESVKTFEVSNAGSANSTLIFTVDADPDWIQVSPNTGTIVGNTDTIEVTVTVNSEPELLKQYGFNEGEITVQDSNGSVVIPVTAAPDYLTEVFNSNDFDLDFRVVTFTPAMDETASYYVAESDTTADFPVDPTGGLDLGPFFLEDDPVAMSPFLGKLVRLYGENYNVFFVGSDGYVSFADTVSTTPSLEQHFAIPRISALYKNLDPTLGGTVSAVQTPDAVAVTYENVPEEGTMNSNDFQIVMYFDGQIQIAYRNVDAVEGIAGLSFGAGLPSDFVESDLSAFNTGAKELQP